MKKFLVVFLLVFSFATLSAHMIPYQMTYQQAVSYCNSKNMHLADGFEISAFMHYMGNNARNCTPLKIIANDGYVYSYGRDCMQDDDLKKANAAGKYWAVCIKNGLF